jgi:hypothetical protein
MIAVHVTLITLTMLVVLYSDHEAFAWMRGKRLTLDATKVARLHRLVSIGLAGIILTGGYMYSQAADYYLGESTFLTKMTAVAALIINSYFIGKLGGIATTHTFASLSNKQRLPLLISGAVSTLGWLTAITCGLLLS